MDKCAMAFTLLFVAGASVASATPANRVTFSEATLERALESGCSLVVAEIREAYAKEQMHYYKARIIRTIVAGDLQKEEAYHLPDLFAGASYGTALKPGSHYAMFIQRDYPHEFSWAFRDDVVEMDPSDEEAARRLVEVADRVYVRTSIRRFRRTAPWPYVKPPDLPDGLAALCRQFREQPGRRAEIGRKIAESDLGSRIDDSKPFSSMRTYLPPRISLSRQEVLSLLGGPAWKNGWMYSWRCDDFVHAREGGREIGVLHVVFDDSERAVRVLFGMQERSKWIRPARPNDWFAELDGDPGRVARGFLDALRESDWDRALSFCSESIKAKTRELDSAAAFFQRFVPVAQLAALPPYRPSGYSRRDGKVITVSGEVRIDTPQARWPVRWEWKLVRAGATWLVDFELVPLADFIQKELIKSEMINDDRARRRWESREGIRYVLTPVTDEFVIGQSMRLRLVMKNEGREPAGYTRTSAMVNDPLLVTGPDGTTLPYMDTSYQTMAGPDIILPGEVLVLADAYDVTSQYHIVRPGRYTFQWRGTHPGAKPSNPCKVDVKPGTPSEVELIVERLLPVLPAGWRLTRHSITQSDDDSRSAGQLYVHLVGQPGGKGGDKGVLLVFLKGDDPVDTDPWLKEQFDLWGISPWGFLYARVNEAEGLWPSYRTQIGLALEVRPAQGL